MKKSMNTVYSGLLMFLLLFGFAQEVSSQTTNLNTNVVANNADAGQSITLTYDGGNIPTANYAHQGQPDTFIPTGFCTPEATLTVEVPVGFRIASVRVKYDMVSQNGGYIKNQRSFIYSPSLGMGEDKLYKGDGSKFDGTEKYDRNLSFANGNTGSIDFVLRAWRIAYNNDNCTSDYTYVKNNTWQLIVEFEPLPTCPEVGNLQVIPSGAGEQGATATWQSVAGAQGYVYELRTSGEPESGEEGLVLSGVIDDPAQESLTIAQLEDLEYSFYIKTKCEENESSWKVSTPFKKVYCEPTYSMPTYNQRIQKVAIPEVEFEDSIPSSTNRDRTGVSVPNIKRNATYSFRLSTKDVGAGVAIDFNKNGTFETNEIFGYKEQGNGEHVLIIYGTIPSDVADGAYRMRVWNWGGESEMGDNTPCGAYSYGSWADYTVFIEGEIELCSDVSAPTAISPQAMIVGQTIADIEVEGENLTWYKDEELTEEVEESFVLIEGTHTFYVTQTMGACTSLPTAVTLTITLSVNDLDLASLKYWPNPVDSELTVSYKEAIRSIEIYDILGKQIKAQKFETNEARLDVSRLAAGTYMLKVQTDTGSQFVKIVKK